MNDILEKIVALGLPGIIIGILSFGLTFLVKMPIKHFTKKINHEGIRKLVNRIIMLIPFGLAIGLWFLYAKVFNLNELITSWKSLCYSGCVSGLVATFIYGALAEVIEGFSNPYASEEGKTLIKNVSTAVSKGENATKELVEDTIEETVVDAKEVCNSEIKKIASKMGVNEEVLTNLINSAKDYSNSDKD